MKKWQLALIGIGAVALIAVAILVVKGSGPTAATVNGVPIPESAVDKDLAKYKQQQPNMFKGAAGKAQEKQLRNASLDALITEELLRQEAKKENIKVPEAEIDAKIAQVKKMFPDQKQFDQVLKQQGITEAELRTKASEQIMAEKMLKKVTGNITVSDKEMKDFYEKNKASMTTPAQKHWRQIVVKDKAKADALLSRLKDDADFAKLAKANSIDETSKNNGGDLGPGVDLPPDVASAVKDVKVNELSDVVKSADGYHIYQLVELKPARQKSFAEVKSQIKQYLEQNQQRAKFTAWLDTLKKKAKIVKTPTK
ncbi:MAG: peptidyl-prolyl cis-trans isomerase [Actinomycetota bacterium]|nr:peptidyl-prolyl cis-trans isomerase [Actinomycetota bacterium]